jgi:hypothetical protein
VNANTITHFDTGQVVHILCTHAHSAHIVHTCTYCAHMHIVHILCTHAHSAHIVHTCTYCAHMHILCTHAYAYFSQAIGHIDAYHGFILPKQSYSCSFIPNPGRVLYCHPKSRQSIILSSQIQAEYYIVILICGVFPEADNMKGRRP